MNRRIAVAAFCSALLPGLAQGAPEKKKDSPHVKLEAIPGSPAKRVTLSARALERLGIETGKVGMAAIERRQMVGGLVIPPAGAQLAPAGQPPGAMQGGTFQIRSDAPAATATTVATAATAATASEAKQMLVQVTLSAPEYERIARDQPVRLLPLSTRTQPTARLTARPSGLPPREDGKRSMLHVFYAIDGADHGLEVNRRVRVELPLNGTSEKQKVVPYSALHYDAKGGAWIYVARAPLVFERVPVGLERVAGELAVLKEGPPEGTPVVTVGAPLLYGAEVFGK